MKILLVNPLSLNDLNRRVVREIPFMESDGFFAPHSCAVVAGLTPDEHEVYIHDENLHGPVERVLDRSSYDVVGLSLVGNALKRAISLATDFREKKRTGLLVAGGPPMMHMLSHLRSVIDVAFIGEAEETWPQFLEDVKNGRHRSLYRQIAKTASDGFPEPRWELIFHDIPRYSVASVQTVRGCPHDCSFCDVIYNFGRKIRLKSIDQILREIRLLERANAQLVYFADDNFAANRKQTKALLRRLIELNKTFETQLKFATQVDITIAEDDELLRLMLDANIIEVQIGIESVSKDSLRDINKLHNLRFDIVEAVRKIQSYGIVVLSHMIVGMDSDDGSAFARCEDFLTEANIVHQACHPLMAPPGTKLWYELKRAGRLVEVSNEMYDLMGINTNIVPKGMSRTDLILGLAKHQQKVSEPERFLERALGFIRGVKHMPSFKVTNQPSPWRMRKVLLSMLRYFLFSVDASERRVFFKLVMETGRHQPQLFPKVMYAFVCHLMERRQAEITARWAREIVDIEERISNGPSIMPRSTVVSEGIRQNSKKIVSAAYRRVRPKVTHRPEVYKIVAEATIDYVERFGETFDTFDDYQLDAVNKSCDRILSQFSQGHDDSTDDSLPEDKPPSGFAREILDAMDQTLRFELRD